MFTNRKMATRGANGLISPPVPLPLNSYAAVAGNDFISYDLDIYLDNSIEPMSRTHADFSIQTNGDFDASANFATIFEDDELAKSIEVTHHAVLSFQKTVSLLADVVENIITTKRAHEIFRERISELQEIAVDEGNLVNMHSILDFWRFILQFQFIKADALFLAESQYLNVVWTDHGKTGRVSITFLGRDSVSFAVIRHLSDGRKTRVVGTNNLIGAKEQIEINQLQGLLEP